MWLQDFRYGFRSLLRNPMFTVVAVLTLALGLGTNTAIFSLVDAVLLKPLPYPEPEKLVLVSEKNSQGQRNAVAGLEFLDWRDGSKSVELAALSGTWLTMTGQAEPERVQARTVSPNFFEVMALQAGDGTRVSFGRRSVQETNRCCWSRIDSGRSGWDSIPR